MGTAMSNLKFPTELQRALIGTKVSPTKIELEALSEVREIQLA